MARYQILYWQEIPSQVRAEEGADEIKFELHESFAEKIDEVATERGLTGTDDYLEHWKWGDWQEREGSAQEVAEAVKRELESEAGVSGG